MTMQWPIEMTQTKLKPLPPSIFIPNYLSVLQFDHHRADVIKECMIMKRVVVIGSSGSGKSTLARQLGDKLQLPVIHLDRYFWHPGWVGTPHNIWKEKVKELVNNKEWIIDGNYRGTLDIRVQAADTVIFLDLPRRICAWRATKRRFQYRNRPRPDIAEGCREPILDPAFPRFLRWIWNYPNRARPNVLQRMKNLDSSKHFVWLKTPSQVDSFLAHPLHWPAQSAGINGYYEYLARLEG